jgi:hypothetical protein
MPIHRIATRLAVLLCAVSAVALTSACDPSTSATTSPPATSAVVEKPNDSLEAAPALPGEITSPVPGEAPRPATELIPGEATGQASNLTAGRATGAAGLQPLQVKDFEKVRQLAWRSVAGVDDPDGDYVCQRRTLGSQGARKNLVVGAEADVDSRSWFQVKQEIGVFSTEAKAQAAVRAIAADIEDCPSAPADASVTRVGSAGGDSSAWLIAADGSGDPVSDYVGVGRRGQIVTVVVFRAGKFGRSAFEAPPSVTLLRAALARL